MIQYENRIGYLYGILLLIILFLVVLFVSCDLDALSEKNCTDFQGFVDQLTQKVNSQLNLK